MIKIPAVFALALFFCAPLFGQKAVFTMPSNNQTVFEEAVVSVEMKTNIQSRLLVFVNNMQFEEEFVSNMGVALTIHGFAPGTNLIRAEVWETIPIITEIPGAESMPVEFSNKLLLAWEEGRVIKEFRLSAGGWIFLSLGWGSILVLCIYTYWKIFGIRKDKIVEPLEIDTLDDK